MPRSGSPSGQPDIFGPLVSARGEGGEVHQHAASAPQRLTTSQGVAVADNQNSLRAGARGPTLLEDFVLRDKIFRFDHERIPERVVHARGYGAHGRFTCTDPIPDLTRAAPFREAGAETEVFVRFSTVVGARGSVDLARDVRGFAVKFYTPEGNWDLVGNNIPVFFVQDAMKFPDLVHAVKPAPDRAFPQAQSAHDNFWDFISLTPEAMHMVMWQMSDRAIPRSFRTMEGFGVHTFRLVAADGTSRFVKFHWKPAAGLQSVLWDEAVKINGADPDFHRRDLWRAVTEGPPPAWDLALQIFDQGFADAFDFDVLDPTKLIPEEILPVRVVGRMVLERVVDNFFAETEQVAFCTQNVIPGIDFTEDPLLQGRNFSYLDTQLKRLGSPNFTQLPVNAPRGCPVHNFHQDGHMQARARKGRVNYEPNGWGEGPREDPLEGYVSLPVPVAGPRVRLRAESFADHYSQARLFYVSQTPTEQRHIRDALVFELSKCEVAAIRIRIVSHLRNVDEGLAASVAEGLGLSDMPSAAPAARPTRHDLPPSPALSILQNPPGDFAGRRLGVLLGEGFDPALLAALDSAAEAAGASVERVGARVGGVADAGGARHPVHQTILGGPSVLYDAVAILAGGPGATDLAASAPARDFLRNAHVHCKIIGLAGADELVAACGLEGRLDAGCHALGGPEAVAAFLDDCARLRHWEREESPLA